MGSAILSGGRFGAGSALALLLPVLLLLIPGAAGADEGSAAEAPMITAVEVRSSLPPQVHRELDALLELRPGEPFSEEAVRRTLRNVQASGRVAEAAVYTRPSPVGAGVEVVVALWANLLVEKVELVGDLGLPERRLRSALEQKLGQPLSEGKLLRGIYGLEKMLQAEGYFGAQAQLTVEPLPAAHRVLVRYRLEAGPQALIGTVKFEGDLGPARPDTLLTVLQLTPGKGYDVRALGEEPERLRLFLLRQGYRVAKVEPAREERGAGETRVDLTYVVDAGPEVLVEVRGGDPERLQKKGLLPFLEDDGYDSALFPRAQRRLLAYFQERGFYHTQVRLWETREAGKITVHVEIEEGPEVRLTEVDFAGNEVIPDSQLRSLMQTTEAQRFRPKSGRLVDSTLREDLENLKSYYGLQGFREVRIAAPHLDEEGDRLRLSLEVEEGPRRLVSKLVWSGGDSVPVAEWLAESPLSLGGPFHPRLLEEAVNGLKARYRAEGYEWIRIEPQVEIISDTLVDVTLKIDEGPQMQMDRLIVRGNLVTRSRVIRRFVDLEKGAPVSRSRLLDVERRLARLGIFSQVNVRPSPGEVGGSDRDVVVQVEEGRTQRMSYGLGYDSEDGARGLLGYSHTNLWGRAVSLRLNARLSQTENRFQVVLRQPFAGRVDLPISYSLFSFDGRRESFSQSSVGLRVDTRKVFRVGSFGVAYDYRIIALEDLKEAIDRIDPQDRELQISSIIPNFVIDRRDDPFDPTRGWSSAVQLQYAFPVLSTDANFMKLFAQQTGQWSLGAAGVIAASLRVGLIEPLNGQVSADPAAEGGGNPVPIGERFFAGGRTSHRAFNRDLLGIDGETRIVVRDEQGRITDLLPGGGNGLLLGSLEYRFPVVGSLGGTLFLDAGNVWRDWRDLDLNEVRYGLGVGLRYRSPIGPVRLEVGWNLDRQPGEDSAEVHLTFGNPF